MNFEDIVGVVFVDLVSDDDDDDDDDEPPEAPRTPDRDDKPPPKKLQRLCEDPNVHSSCWNAEEKLYRAAVFGIGARNYTDEQLREVYQQVYTKFIHVPRFAFGGVAIDSALQLEKH